MKFITNANLTNREKTTSIRNDYLQGLIPIIKSFKKAHRRFSPLWALPITSDAKAYFTVLNVKLPTFQFLLILQISTTYSAAVERVLKLVIYNSEVL